MKYWTGIGSRFGIHEADINKMTEIGMLLTLAGHTLRSGGAEGSDTAFENGVDSAVSGIECFDEGFSFKQIFVPWKARDGQFLGTEKAFCLAPKFVPHWDNCTTPVKKLHARNVNQVIGPDDEVEALSSVLIAWTPKGDSVGGSSTAINAANHFNVPIINLQSMPYSWMLVREVADIALRYFDD